LKRQASLCDGPQSRRHDALATFAFWSRCAAIGYSLVLTGMLLFAYALVDSVRQKSRT
jgi:hypothetical protein